MSQQINLYNPLLLKQKKLFSLNTMAQALGLILLGMFAFYGYLEYRVANLEKQVAQTTQLYNATLAQLERTKAESGPRAPSALLADEIARTEAQLKTRRHIIGMLEQGDLGNRQGFSGYFRALSRQTLEGLWLTAFQVSGAGEVAISGRALKPDLVPAFINRLKLEPMLAGKTFASLEMHRPAAAGAGKTPVPAYIEFGLQHSAAAPTP